jgi:hypothetical protein
VTNTVRPVTGVNMPCGLPFYAEWVDR